MISAYLPKDETQYKVDFGDPFQGLCLIRINKIDKEINKIKYTNIINKKIKHINKYS